MLLLCAYIVIGCYTLIVQVVGVREILVVFYGNELCLGIVFACWLIGVAIGARVAASMIERLRGLLASYGLLVLCLVLFFSGQIFAIRLLRIILQIAPGELLSLPGLFSGALATIAPLGFVVGIIFPVACRLLPGAHADQIGRLYIAEALGSTTGGLLLTFFLIKRYHAFQIAALSGSIVLFTTGILLLASKKKSRGFRLFILLLFLLGAGYGYIFGSSLADKLHTYSLNQRWRSMYPQIELIKSIDSPYENLALGFQADQYVLFTSGQLAAVFPDDYESGLSAHFFMSQHPNPRSILLVGGGAEGMIAEILKYPIYTLDYVELDPMLLTLLASYLPSAAQEALQDPRVSIIHTDGRYYVKQTPHRYDLVILNLPDPTTSMLNRFYTLEFFREVADILNPSGVMITEITSSLHLQQDAANYTGSVYKTLKTVFPYVLVTPGATHIYVAAVDPDVITFDLEILSRRYRERQIASDYFSEYHFQTLLQPEQTAFVHATLQQGFDIFRLNTDMQPITYFYNLLLWAQLSEDVPDRFSPSRTTRLFHTLNNLSLWWFFLPIVGLIIFRLGYVLLINLFRIKGDWQQQSSIRRFNCLWAIGTTGFAAMALELILIFAFQNMYGYIYQKAGLIVALFMIGLAVGAYRSHRKLSTVCHSEPQLSAWLIRCEMLIVLFAALLPLFLKGLASIHISAWIEAVFMILVVVAGLLTGVEFPIGSAFYLHNQQNLGKTAAMLEGADHLGACCGSLLSGVVFVPLLGITISCLLISAIKLSSLCFFVWSTRSVKTLF
ncbi:spermine synthase [Candidatus Vecturithrix granuli]|uniref:Polyamine aminopropyltransferase n=1 Tax=Vecturithrix granuli TaxID=1499967 RepID=A0A081C1L9_VECG1|nr:spermine synthase [Candidatus Vecturithrix granuli]